MQTFMDPDDGARAAFEAADRGAPIGCLNLLRFRREARYLAEDAEHGSAAAEVSGREAYGRYSQVALQHITRVGGRPLVGGPVEQMLIGPDDKDWDLAVIVFYPSRQAFLDMLDDPDYQAATRHRRAGLADTRLIVLDGKGMNA